MRRNLRPSTQLALFTCVDEDRSLFVPLDDDTIWELFTDFPPEEERLTCWVYRLPGSRRASQLTQHADFDQVVREVLLAALALARSKQFHDSDVTIWIGDPSNLYIGLPASTPKALVDHFGKRLDHIEGFEKMRTVRTPNTPLVPVYRYASGVIFAYGEPELAGQVLADDIDGYNTGIPLKYRAMAYRAVE